MDRIPGLILSILSILSNSPSRIFLRFLSFLLFTSD